MITNDLTLENINLRAQIAKLTAPPSEEEILLVATHCMSLERGRDYFMNDIEQTNYCGDAKAAITKFLEMRV